MKRVLILAKVSTGQQETQNQLLQLRQYCEDKNYAVVMEVSENISGDNEKRAGIDTAIELASQARYDLLLFWNLDRFSRLGILKTLQYFKALESYGVEIKSYTQPYLDTSNSSIRELLLAFFSYIANTPVTPINLDSYNL
jgi:DNA invertase Pin-like site-specific DNA recombinase